MNGVRSLSLAHARSPKWVMLKIFIYNLLWLAEYQRKGVVWFNLSDLSFWGQFWRAWKRFNWKKLLLTLIAVTRIINLGRCISQFKCFKFLIYVFFSDPHYFLRSKSSADMNNICKAWRTVRSSVVKPVGETIGQKPRQGIWGIVSYEVNVFREKHW